MFPPWEGETDFVGGLGAMEMESGKIRLKEVKRKNPGRDDWN